MTVICDLACLHPNMLLAMERPVLERVVVAQYLKSLRCAYAQLLCFAFMILEVVGGILANR